MGTQCVANSFSPALSLLTMPIQNKNTAFIILVVVSFTFVGHVVAWTAYCDEAEIASNNGADTDDIAASLKSCASGIKFQINDVEVEQMTQEIISSAAPTAGGRASQDSAVAAMCASTSINCTFPTTARDAATMRDGAIKSPPGESEDEKVIFEISVEDLIASALSMLNAPSDGEDAVGTYARSTTPASQHCRDQNPTRSIQATNVKFNNDCSTYIPIKKPAMTS